MENVRINFEVPKSPLYTVDYLTERARRYVMGLIFPQEKCPSDEELAAIVDDAMPVRTAEEEHAELARRWKQMKETPSSAYTSQEVFDYIEALV